MCIELTEEQYHTQNHAAGLNLYIHIPLMDVL